MALPLMLSLGVACEPDPAEPSHAGAAPAAAQRPDREGNAVTHWTAIASDLMVDPGPIIDSRAFAILHAAIHDAVNGVERRYRPYTADLSFPGASLEAAVATAARDVLVALSPTQQTKIDAEYVAALAAVPDGAAKTQGVALGRRSANANLDRRASDGIPVGPWPPREGPITRPAYVPTGEPGDYDFTPPFDAAPLGPIALFPGWGRLEPFVVDPKKHRLDGPDPLGSRRYARDLNYLKSIGRLHSSTRTADQTEIARFWFEEFMVWNRIANSVIQRNNLDSWRAARVMAQVHFAMADAGIACFEAKYRFRTWRPYTAIRRADEDGNHETEAGANWLPLLWPAPGVIPPPFFIPPIPEYPSAAAMLSAAAAEVLIGHFGDQVSFEATSISLPDVTRRFTGFTQAARENGMSRVYGGIHFLDAVGDGYRLGKRIGGEVSRSLPPVHR
ncbi:MAG: phosphatase PAP2 family protein [Acidobacteria bacterium]|nr:phosphatase PAP2 family protein [Acidobacteriota bacterium]